MKLYIYEHCPFCIRPRMVINANGLKDQVTLEVLANDDEAAHISRVGVKQVPFLEKNDGEYLLESLVICDYFNQMKDHPAIVDCGDQNQQARDLVTQINDASRYFVYPRFILHPQNQADFPTESAKDYFRAKKQKSIGDFTHNLKHPEKAIEQTKPLLAQLNQILAETTFLGADQLSWDDVFIFPVLRNLTIAQDVLTLPDNVANYVKRVAEKTQIDLYQLYDFSAVINA